MKTHRFVSQLRDEEPFLPEVGTKAPVVAVAPTTTSDRRTRSSKTNTATAKKLQRQQRQHQNNNNGNAALDELVYQSNRDVVQW